MLTRLSTWAMLKKEAIRGKSSLGIKRRILKRNESDSGKIRQNRYRRL